MPACCGGSCDVKAAPATPLERLGWLGAGTAGGCAFGATLAGPMGLTLGAAVGAFAGVLRAATGKPLTELITISPAAVKLPAAPATLAVSR